MRSNNLLMSLLANSSANPRSNSLMHKEAYSNPYGATARSNSISCIQKQNKPVKEYNAQQNAPLIRFVHYLNLKVKNHYYFFFCKLEQISKHRKKINKENVEKGQYVTKIEQISAPQQCLSKKNATLQQKLKNQKKGLLTLCDTFNTIKSKRETLLQKQSIQKGFLKILYCSSKKKGIIQLSQLLSKLAFKGYRSAFDVFAKIERDRIRNQIFSINLSQIFTKQIVQPFKLIKIYAKIIEQKAQIIQMNSNEYKCEQLNPPQKWNEPMKGQEQLSAKYQSSEKANRAKKIILRQRKVPVSQPIAFVSIKKNVAVSEDSPLQPEFTNRTEQKMGRCNNLKPELMIRCLPDLNDNGNLFHQSGIPTFSSNKVYTVQNYYTQFKQSSDFQCLTDRSNNNTKSEISRSIKNTPKYCKDKSSINLTLKKQVNLINPDQSPLAKIDQILNRIEQMKAYGSTDRSSQKRMVNVNIQKSQQIEPINSIKYRMKTPNTKYQESQKENIRERLITQRQKPSKKGRGLESGSKYRSTVLTKSKQQKSQFTAKKMKMEIENIINRRNKQLYYRAESTQLN